MTALTRRQLLGTGAVAAGLGALGLTGCSGGGSAASGNGKAELQLAWWGNPLRNEDTDKAVATYLKDHPDVTIHKQPGDWSSYWDKLATQVAGNNAPDVIQMSTQNISEYGGKGALMDLKGKVDTSKFSDGTVDPGMVDGKLVGVTIGMATIGVMVNPKVFEDAGVDLPDDKTWTWDDYRSVAAEVTGKSKNGVFGSQGSFAVPGCLNPLQAWLRQHDLDLFTTDGNLGFSADDLVPYFQMVLSFEKAKAIPPGSVIAESQGKSFDQAPFVQGKQGIAWYASNQFEALTKAAGTTLKMLRFPSVAGKATERQSWFVPTMLWSVSARTKYADAACELVDWWVNSTECGKICLDERGLPPNSDVLKAITPELSTSGKTVVQFVEDTTDELGAAPAPVPAGAGTMESVLMRHAIDVIFGRAKPADAAKAFTEETTASIEQQK